MTADPVGRQRAGDGERQSSSPLRRRRGRPLRPSLFASLAWMVLLLAWLESCGLTTVAPVAFTPATPTASPSVAPVVRRPSLTPTPALRATPGATPTATATPSPTASLIRTRRTASPTTTVPDVPPTRVRRRRATTPSATEVTRPIPAPPAPADSPATVAPQPPAPAPGALPATLAEQQRVLNPLAGYEVPWDRLPQYTLAATLHPPDISGRMTLRFPNTTGDDLESLVLRLFPNGRPIYAGRIQVSNVAVEEQPVSSSLEAGETALRVPLPAPLAPGETVAVTLRFTTTVAGPDAGYGILNQSHGVVTLGSWFPLLALYEGGWQVPAVPAVGDAVSSAMALYTLDLTTPADLQIASTGEAVSREEDGAWAHWRLVSGPARDFALAGSSAWSPLSTEVDGLEVRYFAAPGTSNAPVSPQQALQVTAAAVRTYSQAFGPYPARQLDVVEANVPIGGYEYPGLVLFDSRHRVNNDLDLVRYLLTHEVAHQWFYALVGNTVTAEPWLDESLATFATLLTTEAAQGKAAAEARRTQWETEYADVLARRPVGVNQPVYAFHTWRQYRGPVYYAGALMLDDLRRELGDERFFAALRGYVNEFAYRRATTADFRATFERAAGRDLGPFFQRWFVPRE
ncbi:MAG: M1 family aminopeptidase [Ardenticatenaceae bacterium]|nr:M1 family aminopeptidase [Ardenticatenaceae bacterium]